MSTADRDDDVELLTELGEGDEREQQLVDLIRLDYDATLRALTGFVGTGGQIRAIGIAAWGVVIGLAVRAESGGLAGIALAVVLAFAYGDAYHAALYRRALSRALSLETLFDLYLGRLGIDADDPETVLRVRAKLETHRFGMHRSLKPVRLKDIVAARPRAIFWMLYPALAALTVLLIGIYSF